MFGWDMCWVGWGGGWGGVGGGVGVGVGRGGRAALALV